MKTKTQKIQNPFSLRVVGLFAFAVVCAAIWYAMPARASAPYIVDLTDYRSGPVDAWLRSKGFKFERDAGSPDKIALRADSRGLGVEALQPAAGLLVNDRMIPNNFSAIEIEWGVAQFPQGASYERKVNNEAIMVHVFFGAEKKSSGSMFVPDSPYFIGLFLCSQDRVGVPYIGRYYQEGGRYVCLQQPKDSGTVVSRFNLAQGFQSIFGNVARAVSGYSISVDTSATSDGRSSAFVRRIRFIP